MTGRRIIDLIGDGEPTTLSTPYGTGDVTERREDGFVAVQLPWGIAYIMPPCERTSTPYGEGRVLERREDGFAAVELPWGTAYVQPPPTISFEYFPPRTDDGMVNLKKRFKRMKVQAPLFADVTWGAGGTTSEKTIDLCEYLQRDAGMEANMHLTCTNQTVELTRTALDRAKAAGIRNIVALRGDPPKGEEKWEATEGGFACALDLIRYARKTHGSYFCLSCAGYPEGHPDRIKPVAELGRAMTAAEASRVVTLEDGSQCVCSDEDYAIELKYLKEKQDAGADFIITQLFYDVDHFLQFCTDARQQGITIPIVPGIMPILKAAGFKRMTSMCKTRIPADVRAHVDRVAGDDAACAEYGVELGIKMCKALIAGGIRHLHFYTLNLEKATNAILEGLGLDRRVSSAGSATKTEVDAGLMQTGTLLEGS